MCDFYCSTKWQCVDWNYLTVPSLSLPNFQANYFWRRTSSPIKWTCTMYPWGLWRNSYVHRNSVNSLFDFVACLVRIMQSSIQQTILLFGTQFWISPSNLKVKDYTIAFDQLSVITALLHICCMYIQTWARTPCSSSPCGRLKGRCSGARRCTYLTKPTRWSRANRSLSSTSTRLATATSTHIPTAANCMKGTHCSALRVICVLLDSFS